MGYRISDIRRQILVGYPIIRSDFPTILLDIWEKDSREKKWHGPLIKGALTKSFLRRSLR